MAGLKCTTGLFFVFMLFSPVEPIRLFGRGRGDTRLTRGDNRIQSAPLTSPEFLLHNQRYREVFIGTNGQIQLDGMGGLGNVPQLFPLQDVVMITPFWADVDNSLRSGGTISYRLYRTLSDAAVTRAQGLVATAFPDVPFVPAYLFIATWERVGYFNGHVDLINTFQCTMTTDGNNSFVMLLYNENAVGLQWTAGDRHGNSGRKLANSTAAVVGFNIDNPSRPDSEMKFHMLPNSGNDSILDVQGTTNAGELGLWIFKVDGSEIIYPDPCLFTTACDPNAYCTRTNVENSEFICTCREPFTVGDGFTCSIPDPCSSNPCDPNANCTREGLLSAEFTCTCQEPFTNGDGFTCSEPESSTVEPTTDPTTAATDPTTAATDPTTAITDPTTAATDPTTDPTTAATELKTAANEPTTAATDPTTAATDPTTDPTTAVTDPTTDPTTAVTDPTTDPTTAATELTTAVTYPATVVTDPTTAATEPTTAATEPTIAATDPATAATELTTEPTTAATEGFLLLPSSAGSGSLSRGAIVGIVLAVAAAVVSVIILIGILICCILAIKRIKWRDCKVN